MKVVWSLLALCLVLTLVACGKRETQPTTDPGYTTQPSATQPSGSITVIPEEDEPKPPMVSKPGATLPDISMPPERPPDIPPPQNPTNGPQLPDQEEK